MIFVHMTKDTLRFRKELRQLLSEQQDAATFRALSTYSTQINAASRPIVFVGAGGLFRSTIAKRSAFNEEVVGVTDNDRKKWNTTIAGIPVLSPKDAAERWGKNAAFVVSIWSSKKPFIELRDQFRSLGCPWVIPIHAFFWKYPTVFLPYYSQSLPSALLRNKKKIEAVFDLLNDDTSRRLFLAYLRHRLWLDFDSLPVPDFKYEYFPHDLFSLTKNEVLVDVGAYTGDSLELFFSHVQNKYGKVIAFEPDPRTYEQLYRNFGNKPRVILRTEATSHKNGWISFDVEGKVSSSVNKSGKEKIKSVSLDTALFGESPTIIKMDIEGSELPTLQGMLNILRKERPILAVCMYHKPDDIFSIPLFLKEHTNQYSFYMRNHDYDGIQLVWYAVPNERCL